MNDLMKYAPCGYLQLTKQGIIKDVNETLLEMLNYEYETIVDSHIEIILNLANRFIFHTYFVPEIQRNGNAEELYINLKGRDGGSTPFILNARYTENSKGEERINCIFVKMSKRLNYEQELQKVKNQLEDALKSKDDVLQLISKQKQLFETTLFSINEGIIVTDELGNIQLLNQLAEQYTGWTAEEAIGQPFTSVFRYEQFKVGTIGLNPILQVFTTLENYDFDEEVQLISKDGQERFIKGTAAGIKSDDGSVSGVVVSFNDITKEYTQEKEIEGFLNVNLDILCVADIEGYFRKVNKKFEEILGYTIEDLEGINYLSLVHEDDIQPTLNVVQQLINQQSIHNYTNRFLSKNGTYKYIEWNTEPNGKYTYSSARDVTSQRMLEARLSQANSELLQKTEEMKMKNELLEALAVTDELTGAYNRHFFDMKSKELMTMSDSTHSPLSMIILDLDFFKKVNDTWGHPIGDEVLKQASIIAKKIIRESDFLIRLGGEEFVILLPELNVEASYNIAENIRTSIEDYSIPIVGSITASFGVAERLSNEPLREWYERLDEALYLAKQNGRNQVVRA